MDILDDTIYYLPNPGAKPLLLPELPSPVNSSSSTHKKSTLSKWFLGPSSTPVAWSFDADHTTAYSNMWQTKWNYYQQCFLEDILAPIERMSVADIKARAVWLENELKRIQDTLTTMEVPNDNLEIYTGMMFMGTLTHDISPCLRHLDSLESSNSDDQVLDTSKKELRNVERAYAFLTQSLDKVVSLRNFSALRSMKSALKHTSTQKDSNFTGNSESRRARVSGPGSISSTTSRSAGNLVELELSGPSNYTAVDDYGPIEAEGRPAAIDGQTAGLSAVSSHRTNLAALLAIAFFGASVAWSTLFSGTRGNLEIISWAASVFIVGCAAAASASLLVETDESFMTKYIQVRWTVRILTIVSAAHVLAGLILVSAAIAVLDPSASEPSPGPRYVMKAAGWYAVGMAMAMVITMIMVRRRYTQRTWFRR